MGLLWIAVACGLIGLFVGRWWALLVPVVLWGGIALFLVINDGWYGAGWGDFGIALNVITAILSVLLAAAGVGLRGNMRSRRGRGSTRPSLPH
jgi:hypothetical protein